MKPANLSRRTKGNLHFSLDAEWVHLIIHNRSWHAAASEELGIIYMKKVKYISGYWIYIHTQDRTLVTRIGHTVLLPFVLNLRDAGNFLSQILAEVFRVEQEAVGIEINLKNCVIKKIYIKIMSHGTLLVWRQDTLDKLISP